MRRLREAGLTFADKPICYCWLVRFGFQAGVEGGLVLASPALAARAGALTRADDWSDLDLETQAVGLTLGPHDSTRPWLETLVLSDPRRALELALRASRYTLRLTRAGNSIARVLEATDRTSTAALPAPEFWRELRRVLDVEPGLRGEASAVADAHTPADVRVRAGVAFVFHDEPRWWTEADQRAVMRIADPEAGALVLLAKLRHERRALWCLTWPPAAHVLNGQSEPRDLKELGAALSDLTNPRAWWTVAHVAPTEALLSAARELTAPTGALQLALHTLVLEMWSRELDPAGQGIPRILGCHGQTFLNERDGVRLRAALRRDDTTALTDVARRSDHGSLSHFAGNLFMQWLLDDCPQEGRWAATALGWFPSDAWSEALAELVLLWARRSRGPVSAPLAALAKPGTVSAMRLLSRLSRERGCDELRSAVSREFERCATAQQLTPFELEDRLFPSLSLPTGASVRVEPGPRVTMEREGAPVELDASWVAALEPLAGAVRRLERLMSEGAPLSAVHFTETWGMNPLLFAVARGLVWGVFKGDTLVRLMVPGHEGWMTLGDGVGVRPVHPLEMSAPQRHEISLRLSVPQPFPQLERTCFGPEWPDDLSVGVNDREVFHERLTDVSWEPGPAGTDCWERHGPGWSVRVSLGDEEGEALGCDPFTATVSISGVPPHRVMSELQRELFDAAWARQP